LLAGSVLEIIEPFAKSEVFEILNGDRRSVAVARSLISSAELEKLGRDNNKILAQPNEIILL